jgi:hypothetical protein
MSEANALNDSTDGVMLAITFTSSPKLSTQLMSATGAGQPPDRFGKLV